MLFNPEIHAATLAARKRTGLRIAVAVENGKYQVQSVSYNAKGISLITALSGFVSAQEIVPLLNSLNIPH